jgi:hypothetical protein
MIIGFPIIIAASADLKGIQNGKLNGTITSKSFKSSKITYQGWFLEVV